MAIVSGYDPKAKVTSWTLWFNGAVVVVSALAEFLVANVPDGVGVSGMILGVANIILRFKTNRPII